MRKNRGFTLIEVMVAVGILAIALPTLLLNMMGQIDGTTHLRDKLQAQWVAENVMAGIRIQNGLDGKVPEGDNSGSEELAGRQWYWKTRTRVFPQEDMSDMYGVEVSVWANEESKSDGALVQLVGILRRFNPEPVKMPEREMISVNHNTEGAGKGGTDDKGDNRKTGSGAD